MKNMKRALVTILLIALVFVTTLPTVFAFPRLNRPFITEDILETDTFHDLRNSYLISKYGDNYLEVLNRNAQSAENATKIRNLFPTNRAGDVMYPDFIGGLYINNDENLIIQIVKSSIPSEDSNRYSLYKNVLDVDNNSIVEYVEFSQNQLDSIHDALANLLLEDALPDYVSAIYVDTVNNQVVVELLEYDLEKINQFKNEIMDSPVIDFKKGEQATFTADINVGGPISPIGCSVGYRARKNSTGKGFVTAGHCVSSNQTISGFGTVKNRQLGGNMDAAWIDSSNATGAPTNNWYAYAPYIVPSGSLEIVVKNSFTVGQIINKIGAKTIYQSGKITNTSWSGKVAASGGVSYSFSKLVSTDAAQENGDSGGIVYYTISGTATLPGGNMTAGIATIASNGKAIFSRADFINEKFSLSRY